jgi:hypothetical protein
MKNTLAIPETFPGVGNTKDGAGPLEAVRVRVPQPEADQVLIRVASSLNPLDDKLADLNFFGREPPLSSASTCPALSWP